MTHTYATLKVSRKAFGEISAKLVAAGYSHMIHVEGRQPVIDMHGIGLVTEKYDRNSHRPRRRSGG